MNELVKLTATQQLRRLHSREISAVELFQVHAEIIEATNGDINALVTLCLQRGLEEARLADEAMVKHRSMGRLHGLPYAVKDTLPTQRPAYHIRFVIV